MYLSYLLNQVRVWNVLKGVPLFRSVLRGLYNPPAHICPVNVYEDLEFLLNCILSYG